MRSNIKRETDGGAVGLHNASKERHDPRVHARNGYGLGWSWKADGCWGQRKEWCGSGRTYSEVGEMWVVSTVLLVWAVRGCNCEVPLNGRDGGSRRHGLLQPVSTQVSLRDLPSAVLHSGAAAAEPARHNEEVRP